MTYLASPYSHPDPAVRAARFDAACRATANLLLAGEIVLSPIVHSHPLVTFGLPTDWSFWSRIDRAFLERADEVLVLPLDGWDASFGVAEELRLAQTAGKPVRFLAAPVGTREATGLPTLAPGASGTGV